MSDVSVGVLAISDLACLVVLLLGLLRVLNHRAASREHMQHTSEKDAKALLKESFNPYHRPRLEVALYDPHLSLKSTMVHSGSKQ